MAELKTGPYWAIHDDNWPIVRMIPCAWDGLGAYAVEDDKIVLIDTLEYETMDYIEFRANLDAFSLAVTQHYPVLSGYRTGKKERG